MLIISFLLGLCVGSFLNVYIFRLRQSTSAGVASVSSRWRGLTSATPRPSVWRGRSYCPKCKKPLRWFELIPLLSFIIQFGLCRGCRQKIDWQYPLVELATGILFVVSVWNLESGILNLFRISDFGFRILIPWYLLSVLVVLFVYDLRYGLVPDRVVLPAIAVAFVYDALHVTRYTLHNALVASGYTLVAIAIGAGFFAAQYYISRGRWLGAGDIRIGALMGAMLGWPHILIGLVVSYMLGGLVGVILLASGRKKFGQTVPLGTFLTVGTAIVFLYGNQIWQWYFRL